MLQICHECIRKVLLKCNFIALHVHPLRDNHLYNLVQFLGNFDALLQWPFSYRVTFMLLDQNNKEHQVDSFRPDPNSSSFKRPTTEMNIASGCPLFIPLAKLDDPSLAYVKEDTMFIKLVVDVPRG